jgi:xanthine/CO dehydrogenase XdhC/CoxF family maturation factor
MNPLPERVAVRLDTSLELLLEHAPADDSARVLATVVATAGSTYRKPGARMLIMADGSYRGLLSGGCLEADLKIHAQEVLDTGVARAVEYDMRGPDELLFGLGAGCEGAMRVLLEPAAAGSIAAVALTAAMSAARQGLPTSLVMVHEACDLGLGTYAAAPPLPLELVTAGQQALANTASTGLDIEADGRRTRAFIQFLAPPPHLLICGAGPDAQPVVSAARALGWRVTVVDHRRAYVDALRALGDEVVLADADSLRTVVDIARYQAFVVMSHHLNSDAAYLRELAAAGTRAYVGLLGPRARRSRLMQELGGAADRLQAQLHSPVGLNLGAVTPEAIALAIVSEIHGWLAGHERSGCGVIAHHVAD